MSDDFFSQFETAPAGVKPIESASIGVGNSSGDYFDSFSQVGQETKGVGGVAKDLQDAIFKAAMSVPGLITSAPGEIMGAGKQLAQSPMEIYKMARGEGGAPRIAQNIGAGLGEAGNALLSAPGALRDYLARKDLVSQNAPSFRLPESVLPHRS